MYHLCSNLKGIFISPCLSCLEKPRVNSQVSLLSFHKEAWNGWLCMLLWARGLFDNPADTVALSPPGRAWALGSLPQALSCHDGTAQQPCFIFLPLSSTSPILWSHSNPQPSWDLSFGTTEMTSFCPLAYLNPPKCVSTCFSLLFESAVRYKYHSWASAIPAKQRDKRHSVICMWGGLCCFSRNFSF